MSVPSWVFGFLQPRHPADLPHACIPGGKEGRCGGAGAGGCAPAGPCVVLSEPGLLGCGPVRAGAGLGFLLHFLVHPCVCAWLRRGVCFFPRECLHAGAYICAYWRGVSACLRIWVCICTLRQMCGAMLMRAHGASKACLCVCPRVCVPMRSLASRFTQMQECTCASTPPGA